VAAPARPARTLHPCLPASRLPSPSPCRARPCASVVVHVFTPEERERYDVESFYGAAEELDLPFAQGAPGSGGSPGGGAAGWSKQL
jgi:hypothetical protein